MDTGAATASLAVQIAGSVACISIIDVWEGSFTAALTLRQPVGTTLIRDLCR
jgi:hypothetical protein